AEAPFVLCSGSSRDRRTVHP
ncbi:MAG: hypothetical protein AVDCRST_MAG64-3105, partial [uncultured Phycisphaerae bacterium]